MLPLNFSLCLQCGRSSLSQDGGANLRHRFIKKVQTTLNTWMGRPQLLPEIFKIVLRPIWWATWSEQPSPPLHRAAAAQLLTWSGTLLLCISISWLNSVCISLLTNHISAREWELDQCIAFASSQHLFNWCTLRLHSGGGVGGGDLLVSLASVLFWWCCICWLKSHHISQLLSISLGAGQHCDVLHPASFQHFEGILICYTDMRFLLTFGTDQLDHIIVCLIVPYWFFHPQTLLACWWCIGAD